MASDEIIWNIINNQFCSFKLTARKPQTGAFCKNEYNSTGLCNRQSCPLANSRYATVRSHPTKDVLYLYIKTIERAHLPSKLWEKIKLSANYAKALEQIDEKLMYFPKFQRHKAKQRLTRLTQVAIRTRRLATEEERLGEKMVPKLAPKIRHRERARERKAEAAAKIDRTIERELIERLRQGAYGDQPLNVSEQIWAKVLKALEKEGEGTRDKDRDRGIKLDEDGNKIDEDEEEYSEDDEEDEEEELDGQVEYVSDLEESDDELEDIEDWLGSDDDESPDEEDDDEDDDDEETGKSKKGKAVAAGDKRKRGRVVRVAAKRKKLELEKEEEKGSRQKLLAF